MKFLQLRWEKNVKVILYLDLGTLHHPRLTTSYFHVALTQPNRFHKISMCWLLLGSQFHPGLSPPTESAQDLTRRAKHCPISSTYMKQNRSIWHNSPLQIGSIQPKSAIFCLVEASTNVNVVVIYLAKKWEETQPRSFAKFAPDCLHQLSRFLAKKARGKSLFVCLPSVWVDSGKSCN